MAACAIALLAPATAHASERLIVGFKPSTSTATRVTELRDAGTNVTTATALAANDVPKIAAVAVTVAEGDGPETARELLASGTVAFVENDQVASIGAVTNDPLGGQQWALGKLRATSAWDTTTGTGVIVAVVDTGVSFGHGDLAERVDTAGGWDFVDGDADASDVQGHGTHVAGIIAANGNNSTGVAGVAYGARILPVRVLDADGSGYYSWIANGIIYAADHGAKVINLSLGGSTASTALENAVNYATSRGAVVTCASGNSGASSLGYPARYSGCFAVGSTNSSDARSSFSQYGTNIDIVAPGSSILSTVMGNKYESWSGTSMATPQVSGAAALLASQGLNRAQIEATLRATAKDLGAVGYDTTYGSGRIDAASAVAAGAGGGPTPTDIVNPTVSAVTVGDITSVPTRVRYYNWKVTRTTRWRKVGTSKQVGAYNWSYIEKGATWRKYIQYRMRKGVVRRREVTRKRKTLYRNGTANVRTITVASNDNVAVVRAGLSINGKWFNSDTSPADGFSFVWKCAAGSHTFTGYAFDASENQASLSQVANVTC